MLTPLTYKVLHLLGIFLLFSGFGGLWVLSGSGPEKGDRARRLLLATHGIALLLILFAGFGMLARLGITGGLPPWVWIKLAVWLVLGASPFLLRRAGALRSLLLYVLPILGAVAAYSVLFRVGEGP